MKKALLLALALIAVGYADVQAQNLSTDDVYNDVTNALVAYGSVARVCEHRQFLDLKTTLIQFLEFQNGKRVLTTIGRRLYRDVESYLDRGVAEYQRRPYVTCGQAPQYYRQLIEVPPVARIARMADSSSSHLTGMAEEMKRFPTEDPDPQKSSRLLL